VHTYVLKLYRGFKLLHANLTTRLFTLDNDNTIVHGTLVIKFSDRQPNFAWGGKQGRGGAAFYMNQCGEVKDRTDGRRMEL